MKDDAIAEGASNLFEHETLIILWSISVSISPDSIKLC